MKDKIKPIISVMINNFNYGKTIERAIDSALNQTIDKSKYEVLVVDDGSTDDSWEKIISFGDKINAIRQENKGAYAANNVNFKRAKGEYIIKLDTDDWFEPEILEKMLNAFKGSKNTAFAYSDFYHIKNKKKVIESLEEFDIFKTIACGILFKKNKIIKVNNKGEMYSKNLFYPEYDLLIKLTKRFDKVYCAGKPLYSYYRHGKSITANPKVVNEGMKQLEQLHGMIGNPP